MLFPSLLLYSLYKKGCSPLLSPSVDLRLPATNPAMDRLEGGSAESLMQASFLKIGRMGEEN